MENTFQKNTGPIPIKEPNKEKANMKIETKEYFTDDYKILLTFKKVIENNNLNVNTNAGDDFTQEIREILSIAVNNPDLRIFSLDGKRLFASDFDEARNKLWKMKDELINKGKEDVVNYLNNNTYTKWDNVGSVINVIRDMGIIQGDILKKWQETFSKLQDRKNIEKKTGITDELDESLNNLIIEIYNSIDIK